MIVTITAGGKTQTSAPIMPGKGDKAYAIDNAARKLMSERSDPALDGCLVRLAF